jgi:hypothetical protein
MKVGDLVWVYRNAHPSQEKFIGVITEIEDAWGLESGCSVFVTFFDGDWGAYHPSQINLIPKEGEHESR